MTRWVRLGGGGRGTDWVCYLDHHPACGIHPLLLTQWGWSLFFPSTSHSFSFIHFVPTPKNIVTHWLNWSLSKFNLSIHISAKLSFHQAHCVVILIQTLVRSMQYTHTYIYITCTALPTVSTCICFFNICYYRLHQ